MTVTIPIRHQFAQRIAQWTDPRYLVGPVVLAAALRGTGSIADAVTWTVLVLCIAVLPVLAFIAWQTRRSVYVDSQIPEQRLRTPAYLVGNVSLLVGLILLVLLEAPHPLITLLAAMLAANTIALSLNVRWKVSVHTGSAAGAAVALVALIGAAALPALLLIPLVGWTRVSLGRHTLEQIIVGGLVGGGVTALIFWLA